MEDTKELDCGCCGTIFRTWQEYKDQDQDKGYGICKSCQEGDEQRYYDDIEKGFDLLVDADADLKEKTKTWTFDLRQELVLAARNDGTLS